MAARRLGVAVNGVFTASNTDPIPGGRLWSEAALMWNAMRADAILDGISPADFMPAGPVSSARPIGPQRIFYANQPPPAAFPGTSNHGWGTAVDVLTRAAAAWIMRNGARFGWSHAEGLRVGEWWHFTYVGASKRARAAARRFRSYTDTELRRMGEFDRLRRARRDPKRRASLGRAMATQARSVKRAALAERDGWSRHNRRARYRSLQSRRK